MLSHLATARFMAEASESYRMNAERVLAGRNFFLEFFLGRDEKEGKNKRAWISSIRKTTNIKD